MRGWIKYEGYIENNVKKNGIKNSCRLLHNFRYNLRIFTKNVKIQLPYFIFDLMCTFNFSCKSLSYERTFRIHHLLRTNFICCTLCNLCEKVYKIKFTNLKASQINELNLDKINIKILNQIQSYFATWKCICLQISIH